MKLVALTEDRIQDVCRLWNQGLAPDFPIRERIVKQNVFQDRNFLPQGSWLAVEEATGKAIGFVVSKVWQDSKYDIEFSSEDGWIHALMVDPDHRNQGIGSELLRQAESALHGRGVRRVSLGNDFHRRVLPGVPHELAAAKRWFERNGYAYQGMTHDLVNHYDAKAQVALPQFENVVFRLAQPNEEDQVIAFMKRCFPGRWEYQTRQYWQLGGTGREFVVLEREEDIIGFCRINDSQSPILAQNVYWAPLFQGELGGIGPLGIDEKYRGLNYGLAIVQAGIHYLLQRGASHIVIDTTPYVDFYGKHGFSVWKSYDRFQKVLEA
ncbi:GNAT family N-acetyltransferase [Paenibacillus aestuarii]|uniref:GNAT family N-acetyltransferase n=1 Tax=Paenibacillus aestuarii TaxID=516965 RepID=A0ABW0K529_9BACL|nr:GNAT family N-acetyltransferase [Paenibacillus aestuarii]